MLKSVQVWEEFDAYLSSLQTIFSKFFAKSILHQNDVSWRKGKESCKRYKKGGEKRYRIKWKGEKKVAELCSTAAGHY